MVDISTAYPEYEDIQEGMQRCFASIRDNLSDIEMLMKRLVENQIYVPEERVCQILHCTSDEIPQRIPSYHIGRNYIYKLNEVYDYIESKKIGGKR